MKVSSVRNLVPIRDGQGVEMTLLLVRYGSSTSGTVAPTVWTEEIPEVAQGNFLWTWTHTEYSNGKATDAYSISRIGIDGKGVKSSKVDYSMQETSVDPTTITNWGNYPSTLRDGFWLYTRTVMVYSDDMSTTSYSVSQIGVGSYYAGVMEYYCASSSPYSPAAPAPAAGTYANGEDIAINDVWKQERPDLNSSTPYLWNFEISVDSRGNKYVTLPVVIGNFAKGIASVVETYCISKFSKPDIKGQLFPSDCIRWSDEQVDAAPTEQKPYQWNRTQTTYNDNSVDYRYHVSAVRGTKGKDAHSPIIGDNGNWWFWDDTLNGYKDSGESAAGDDGHSPYIGSNGHWFQWDPEQNKFVDSGTEAQGAGGSTPVIGENGHWYIDEVDTGVSAEGAPGSTPYIGQNGNWWIGESDTGVSAEGAPGSTPSIGVNGNWWINGEDTGRPAQGDNGHSPYVDKVTGTWWEYNAKTGKYEDTGIVAKGDNGITPHIGEDGYWWIGEVRTGIKAQGSNGNSPYIGEDGNWWIGTTDTGVKATGDNGYTPKIGPNGNWWINGEDTGDPARGDEGHSPYIDDETGTWWYWDHEAKKYVDSGIKPKGDDGAPGADGSQDNLFGYGNYIDCASDGYWSVAHTKTGFAAFIKAHSASTTFVNIFYGDAGSKNWPVGVYAVSCKVKFTNKGGMPELFNVFGTMQNGKFLSGSGSLFRNGASAANKVQCNVEYTVAFKFELTSEYFPYFALYNLSGLGDVYFVMEVSNLKIERAEGLNGVSTPFNGLAVDRRPVNPNLLLDTQKLSVPAKWNNFDGVVTANSMAGCSSIRKVNSSGTYIDMLKQILPEGKLKPNRWYTLSYYAKCSGTCYSYCYPNVSGFNTATCEQEVVQMTEGKPWTKDGEWWVSGVKGVNSGSSVMKVTLKNNTSSVAHEKISIQGSSEANYDYFYISEEYLTTFSAVKNSTTCIDKRSGNMGTAEIVVDVPANSSKVLYVGYCKDGSGNTYDDQYKIMIGRFLNDIKVLDGKAMDGTPHNDHTIEQSTQWVRHSVTFRTSAKLSGAKQIFWRVMSGATLELAMMKLEEGDAATSWCSAEEDRRGADGSGFNIMSWTDCMAGGSWTFYSKKEMTSELSVADIVIYNSYYYVCIKGYTATASSPTPNNDSEHWKLFQNFANVATDILISNAISTKIFEAVLARIDDLIVKRMRTAESGARIVTEGSMLSVYGLYDSPNIKFGVNADGSAVLEFYDNNGQFKYDLGPENIFQQVQAKFASYAQYTYWFMTGVTASNIGKKFDIYNSHTVVTLWQWYQGYMRIGEVMHYTEKSYVSNWNNEPTVPFVNDHKFVGAKGATDKMPTVLANGIYSKTVGNYGTNGGVRIYQMCQIVNGVKTDFNIYTDDDLNYMVSQGVRYNGGNSLAEYLAATKQR